MERMLLATLPGRSSVTYNVVGTGVLSGRARAEVPKVLLNMLPPPPL